MDVDKKQWKKIFKYIVGDRYKKLAKYLAEQSIPLNAILNRRGEKLLHVAAKEGAANCLEDLVERGARLSLVDRRGNLPLHHALHHCLEQYRPSLEHSLVSPLLTLHSPALLNLQNLDGVSCRDLLARLEALKNPHQRTRQAVSTSSDSDSESYSERKWREKLAAEADDEFTEHVGKFHQLGEEEDGTGTAYGQEETYDDWADRIFNAFSERRRRLYAPPPSSAATSRSKGGEEKKRREEEEKPRRKLGPEIDLEEAGRSLEELRKRRQLAKIRAEYTKIFNTQDPIGAGDIPYRGLTPAAIIDSMLQDILEKSSEEVKKRIREEIRQWHPDKFAQKFANRIKKGEQKEVMERVKTIAQALTSYGK